MENKDYQEALQEIVRGMEIMLSSFKQATKIYDGVALKDNTNGTWQIKFNGEIHNLTPYGDNAPVIGDMVKVFVPQDNYNLAWFLTSVPKA